MLTKVDDEENIIWHFLIQTLASQFSKPLFLLHRSSYHFVDIWKVFTLYCCFLCPPIHPTHPHLFLSLYNSMFYLYVGIYVVWMIHNFTVVKMSYNSLYLLIADRTSKTQKQTYKKIKPMISKKLHFVTIFRIFYDLSITNSI